MPIVLRAKDIYEEPRSIIDGNNAITATQLNAIGWDFKVGEVSPRYTNVYFDDSTLLGNGEQKDFPITTAGTEMTTLYAYFPDKATFNIEKTIVVNEGQRDYSFVRERSWRKSSNTATEWVEKTISSENCEYIFGSNTFSASLNEDVNDNVLKKNDPIDMATRVSEDFYVVGRYLEQKIIPYYTTYATEEQKKHALLLPENELVRKDTLLSGSSNTSYAQNLVDIVYNKYKNGKEAYTLKCALGNYYDENGMLKVSIDDESLPCLIPKHTVVTPYVFSAVGEVPLSTKSDGSAKLFEVIGTDFQYSGVPWQILTVQEYAK